MKARPIPHRSHLSREASHMNSETPLIPTAFSLTQSRSHQLLTSCPVYVPLLTRAIKC